MYFMGSVAGVFVSACSVPQKIASRGKQAAATKCVLESVRIRLVENGLSAYIFASLPSQRPAGEQVPFRAATPKPMNKRTASQHRLSVSQHFGGRGQQG